MSTREELLAQIAELDRQELGKEAARLSSRLLEIGVEASKLVVASNDQPNFDWKAGFLKAANFAEEAAQLGNRLIAIRKEA